MKTIYLLRHAQAEARDEKVPDKERKLVKDGIEDARIIAKNLRKEGLMPDLILSSDPPRALETAKIFVKNLKFEGPEIGLNKKIYSAEDAESLFEIIKGLDEKYKSVMMVGYDPTLSALAHLLVKFFTFELPKSGVLGIECKKKKWADIVPSINQIRLFMAPMKKKKVGKLRDELTEILGDKLETVIYDTLKESNDIAADRIRKTVKKRSRQIAEEFVDINEYPLLKTLNEISLFFKLQNPEKLVEENK
jgi:phosphohistidine phosphatase